MLHEGKKRVIVFLIYADFRIDPEEEHFEVLGPDILSMNMEMKIELNLLFKEVMTTPINEQNARLFVIFNSIRYNIDRNATRVESKTSFFEIVNVSKQTFNKIGRQEIISHVFSGRSDNGSDTLQVTNKLTPILQKISVGMDEEAVLITWDHGSALGIFRANVLKVNNPAKARKKYDEFDGFPYLKKFFEINNQKNHFNEVRNINDEIIIPIIQFNGSFYSLPESHINKNHFKQILYNENLNCYLKIQKGDGRNADLIFDIPANRETLGKISPLFSESSTKTIELDELIPEILTNNELAVAMDRWLNTNVDTQEKKIGILLMMNCWMMNLHTMYSFRKIVECLIAPQGNIAIPGYNYKDILRYIYKPKSYFRTNRDIAKKIVETCENKFALKRANKVIKQLKRYHDRISSLKVFAIDLQTKNTGGVLLFDKQIEALKGLVTLINDKLHSTKELSCMFKYIRSVCFDFSYNHCKMIDIVHWGAGVIEGNKSFTAGSPLFPQIRLKIEEFRDLIDGSSNNLTLIIAVTKGRSIYNPDPQKKRKAIIDLEPTGYSIFFLFTISGWMKTT